MCSQHIHSRSQQSRRSQAVRGPRSVDEPALVGPGCDVGQVGQRRRKRSCNDGHGHGWTDGCAGHAIWRHGRRNVWIDLGTWWRWRRRMGLSAVPVIVLLFCHPTCPCPAFFSILHECTPTLDTHRDGPDPPPLQHHFVFLGLHRCDFEQEHMINITQHSQSRSILNMTSV